MVDPKQTNQDVSPLAQSPVQWTLVTALFLSFAILAFWFARMPASELRMLSTDKNSATKPRGIVFDLNVAKAHELALLPSIGPVLGERIVDHRDLYGAFHAVKDLERVPGIGPKKLAAIEDYCACTPPILK